MFGLGKPRTNFGYYIDKNKISQTWIIDKIGLDKNTVFRLCNDKDYNPHAVTQIKIISNLRKSGHDVTRGDFWV
jgi:putative transcriptional regulator